MSDEQRTQPAQRVIEFLADVLRDTEQIGATHERGAERCQSVSVTVFDRVKKRVGLVRVQVDWGDHDG
jgi:hypothetical protein